MLCNKFKEIKIMVKGIGMQLKKLDKLDEKEATVKQNNKSWSWQRVKWRKWKKKNADLEHKVAQFELKSLMTESAADADKLGKLEKLISYIEARTMRENLIFYNNEEKETEGVSTEDIIKEIIHNKMGVAEEVRFDRVHRMGSKFTKSGSRRVRPIVAKLKSFKVKEKVKYSSKYLSGSQAVILASLSDSHKKSTRKEKIMASIQRSLRRRGQSETKRYKTLYWWPAGSFGHRWRCSEWIGMSWKTTTSIKEHKYFISKF